MAEQDQQECSLALFHKYRILLLQGVQGRGEAVRLVDDFLRRHPSLPSAHQQVRWLATGGEPDGPNAHQPGVGAALARISQHLRLDPAVDPGGDGLLAVLASVRPSVATQTSTLPPAVLSVLHLLCHHLDTCSGSRATWALMADLLKPLGQVEGDAHALARDVLGADRVRWWGPRHFGQVSHRLILHQDDGDHQRDVHQYICACYLGMLGPEEEVSGRARITELGLDLMLAAHGLVPPTATATATPSRGHQEE
jgi:hypothetical protein